jgi:hypothetical protein
MLAVGATLALSSCGIKGILRQHRIIGSITNVLHGMGLRLTVEPEAMTAQAVFAANCGSGRRCIAGAYCSDSNIAER